MSGDQKTNPDPLSGLNLFQLLQLWHCAAHAGEWVHMRDLRTVRGFEVDERQEVLEMVKRGLLEDRDTDWSYRITPAGKAVAYDPS